MFKREIFISRQASVEELALLKSCLRQLNILLLEDPLKKSICLCSR